MSRGVKKGTASPRKGAGRQAGYRKLVVPLPPDVYEAVSKAAMDNDRTRPAEVRLRVMSTLGFEFGFDEHGGMVTCVVAREK